MISSKPAVAQHIYREIGVASHTIACRSPLAIEFWLYKAISSLAITPGTKFPAISEMLRIAKGPGTPMATTATARPLDVFIRPSHNKVRGATRPSSTNGNNAKSSTRETRAVIVAHCFT